MAQTGLSALDVAKWFINATDRDSGDAITHLKLQKLLYYAQGWHLALSNRPLFDDELQAWAHGPVAVPVYNRFRSYGFDAIPPQKIDSVIPDGVRSLLQGVNDKYGIFSAKRLEYMTHKEPPWKEARGGLPPEARCTKSLSLATMKKHFKGLM